MHLKHTKDAALMFRNAASANKRREYLTCYSVSELMKFDLYYFNLFNPGEMGYAIAPDKEIANLFNNSDIVRGMGSGLIQHAIAHGGRTAFCFEGYAAYLFRENGFVEVERRKWDEMLKPVDWKDENGKPDVVWLKYKLKGV